VSVPAKAQESPLTSEQISVRYETVFQTALDWLAANPEVIPGDPERERILKTLDAPFAEEDAKMMPVVGRYFRERMDAFLRDFEKTKPEKGAVIWKLYNHTFIIRTPQLTIAIDLIGGFDQVAWDDAKLDRAISGIDLLLITHEHADHADPIVVKKFLKAGKQVIVQKEMWKYESYGKRLTRMSEGSTTIKDVKLTVFPAFQGDTPNNIYLIETADGLKIMHIGDDNEMKHVTVEWFRRFKPQLEIDVLLPNCWCPNLAVLLKYVKPKIMISGHEHELSHRVEGRRSYYYVYSVLSTVKVPFLVPAWGEKMLFSQVSEGKIPTRSPNLNVERIAHRGAKKFAPENTLPAIQKAIEMGVNYVELDIRYTKDGVPVCMHDETVNRTTNGTGEVKNMTLDEIKQLDASFGFVSNPEMFKGTQVPTLEEALQLMQGRVKLYMDQKEPPSALTVALLKKYSFFPDNIIIVGDGKHQEAFIRLESEAPVMPALNSADAIPAVLERFPSAKAFNVLCGNLTEEMVKEAHKHGVMVFVNTMGWCDQKTILRQMIEIGPDAIQSDHQDLVLEVLMEMRK